MGRPAWKHRLVAAPVTCVIVMECDCYGEVAVSGSCIYM